jgi:hypothetical protein
MLTGEWCKRFVVNSQFFLLKGVAIPMFEVDSVRATLLVLHGAG